MARARGFQFQKYSKAYHLTLPLELPTAYAQKSEETDVKAL